MNNGESKNIGVEGVAETANPMRYVPASFHRGVGRIKKKKGKWIRWLENKANYAGLKDVKKRQLRSHCAGRTTQEQKETERLKKRKNQNFAKVVQR